MTFFELALTRMRSVRKLCRVSKNSLNVAPTFSLLFLGVQRDFSQPFHRLSALSPPIPGRNFTMRLKATSSRGFATNRMNDGNILNVGLFEKANAAA